MNDVSLYVFGYGAFLFIKILKLIDFSRAVIEYIRRRRNDGKD